MAMPTSAGQRPVTGRAQTDPGDDGYFNENKNDEYYSPKIFHTVIIINHNSCCQNQRDRIRLRTSRFGQLIVQMSA
jgi:hypothetical protein